MSDGAFEVTPAMLAAGLEFVRQLPIEDRLNETWVRIDQLDLASLWKVMAIARCDGTGDEAFAQRVVSRIVDQAGDEVCYLCGIRRIEATHGCPWPDCLYRPVASRSA